MTYTKENFMAMANATMESMVSAVETGKAAMDEGRYDEAKAQLNLYDVLEKSMSRVVNKLESMGEVGS